MKADSQTLNRAFMAKLAAGDKQGAMDAATEFTRLTLREEGLLRKILPPKSISYSDLDKQLDTDKPVKILDKEVGQPPSMSAPFGTLPVNQYISGARYKVNFARLLSRNYTKDIAELNQYDYDIRDLFKDNAIKDHMTAEDIPAFQLFDKIIQSDPDNDTAVGNSASAMTGKVQYHDYTASNLNPRGYTGFSRDSVVDSFTIMTNAYINDFRKKNREPEKVSVDAYEKLDEFHLFNRLSSEAPAAPDPVRDVIGRLTNEDFRAALDALPEEYRTAIVLYDLQGLSYDDVAKALDIPIGTVRSRLARGRRQLQGALYRHAVDAGLVEAQR
jgi:RNA polymerase sigma factor (sigma-70 family)